MSYSRRGGARVGGGRPKKRDAGVPHDPRPALSGAEPVHITLRVRPHVWCLRSRRCFEVIRAAFLAVRGRSDFRVINLSIQGNHLHITSEPADAQALSRGIHALSTRIARGLNRLMGTKGPVFEERYHLRVLRTPTEVRRALAYIENNTAKHLAEVGRRLPAGARDPYTIGYFGNRRLHPEGTAGMTAEPTTWLLRHGWRATASAETPAAEGVRRSLRPVLATTPEAERMRWPRRRNGWRQAGRDILTLPLPFPVAAAECRDVGASAPRAFGLVTAVERRDVAAPGARAFGLAAAAGRRDGDAAAPRAFGLAAAVDRRDVDAAAPRAFGLAAAAKRQSVDATARRPFGSAAAGRSLDAVASRTLDLTAAAERRDADAAAPRLLDPSATELVATAA